MARKVRDSKMDSERISSDNFYLEYHGHQISDLERLHSHLRKSTDALVWLAGDSSLDNKHWFNDTARAVNGYEDILSPPKSRQDIAYWMNVELVKSQRRIAVINTAIEESCVGDRSCCRLLPQDKFLRDNIRREDMLVVSVGGNDIALKASPCTICNLLGVVKCSTTTCIRDYACGTALPCDDYCCGGVCGCLSNFLAFPCGVGYFIHLFRSRVQSVVDRMTSKVRPSHIFVCMIYFLDEAPQRGWAEMALSTMEYNSNPQKLQAMIRKLFEVAIKGVKVSGSTVVGVPLFVPLDGKDSSDYVQRVEPSAKGGEKMGTYIVENFVNKYYNSDNATKTTTMSR